MSSSEQQWNFTIDDTSPMFSYSPYGDIAFGSGTNNGSGLTHGWQTWYTGTGFLPAGGQSPAGDSYHLTSLSGASVSLSFYGTGIALSGLANCTYAVTLDGTVVSSPQLVNNVFYQVSSLSPGIHNVTLTAQSTSSNQVLSFNGATVISVANSTLKSPIDETIDNQNTSVITYTGNWTPNKIVSGIPSASTSLPFHTTADLGASALLNFSGRAIAIYGSTTTSHGLYAVNLDGRQYILNGTSEWLLGDALMFYQDGLDENVAHTLNVTNFSFQETLSITSFGVKQFNTNEPSTSASASPAASSSTAASSSPSKHHTNIGAIVGPIVAVIAVILAAAAFLWTRRRQHRGSADSHNWKLSHKSGDVEPFISPGGPPGPSSAGTTLPAYDTFAGAQVTSLASDTATYAADNAGLANTGARMRPAPISEKSHPGSDSNILLDNLMYDAHPTTDERRSIASVPVTAAPFSAVTQTPSEGTPWRPLPIPGGRRFPSNGSVPSLQATGGGYSGAPTALSSGTAQLEGDIVDRIIEGVAARIAPPPGSVFSTDTGLDSAGHLPPYSESS